MADSGRGYGREPVRPRPVPPDFSMPQRSTTPHRGLGVWSAAAVATVLGLVGGLVDVLTGTDLGLTFATMFVTGCVLAALTIRLAHVKAAIVMPPLVYAFIAVVTAAVQAWRSDGGGGVKQFVVELVSSLVLSGLVLAIATAAVVVVALVRRMAYRPPPSPGHPAPGRPGGPSLGHG